MNEGMDTNISYIIDEYRKIMNCDEYHKVWPSAHMMVTYIGMIRSGELENHMNDLIRIGSTTMTLYNVLNVGISTFLAQHEYVWKGEEMYDFIKKEAIDYFGDSLYYLNLELGTEYE